MPHKKHIFLCFLALINLGMFSQNSPKLILPKAISDAVIVHFQNDVVNIESQNLKHFLQVFVETKNKKYQKKFAIQGSYKIVKNSITFTPDFPFMEGQNYLVKTINSIKNSKKLKETNTSFIIQNKKETPKASVVKIHPTSKVLPENTFRFYIYFSTPMKKEVALQHIHLLDENGKEDKHAFMKFKQELWSPDGKRLTLLFDPGRIKRGVSTNVEKGAALVSNKNYELIISNNWKDVYNQSLKETYKKEITVSKGYRTEIKTNNWNINKPTIASQEKLIIEFDRIFDHALLQNSILVKDENNEVINGKITVTENEKKWSFTPDKIWKNDIIFIWIDSRLEDVAGNNFQDLLDHTVQQGSKDILTIKLPITLKSVPVLKKIKMSRK